MNRQLSHRTICTDARSRNAVVSFPQSLQAGHFASLVLDSASSGIEAEVLCFATSETLCFNFARGNRSLGRAKRRGLQTEP
jgi:hypothetical protein